MQRSRYQFVDTVMYQLRLGTLQLSTIQHLLLNFPKRKKRNSKLTVFKDLYRQAKVKVSELVDTVMYQLRLGTLQLSTIHHLLLNFPKRKKRNSKLTVFKDLYRQAKVKVSEFVDIVMYQLRLGTLQLSTIHHLLLNFPKRKKRNSKLTVFKDLYRQAKVKVSELVDTVMYQYYTERINISPSSKEQRQILNTLPYRHPPKIFDHHLPLC